MQVADQEGTFRNPGHRGDTSTCQNIGHLLARISDKWTLLVVRSLGPGPRRFSALRREIGEVSKKMLTSTLRDLEQNGFVTRTVLPTRPPQVEYALTDLGRDFLEPVKVLAGWVMQNSARMDAARAAFAEREESAAERTLEDA